MPYLMPRLNALAPYPLLLPCALPRLQFKDLITPKEEPRTGQYQASHKWRVLKEHRHTLAEAEAQAQGSAAQAPGPFPAPQDSSLANQKEPRRGAGQAQAPATLAETVAINTNFTLIALDPNSTCITSKTFIRYRPSAAPRWCHRHQEDSVSGCANLQVEGPMHFHQAEEPHGPLLATYPERCGSPSAPYTFPTISA